MKKSKNWPLPIGAHWEKTNYSPLYQLCRRVETVARQLGDRRKKGWTSHKEHVRELYDISIQLKVLDKKVSH